MAERRVRRRNFSLQEKEKLLQLIVKHKDTILNKRTDEVAQLAKHMAWNSLTNSFNATGEVYRNRASLMRLWDKLKHKSKNYYNMSLRYKMQAADLRCINPYGLYGSYGPSVMKIDPILKRVCNILSQQHTGFTGTTEPFGHNRQEQKNEQTAHEAVPSTSQTVTAEVTQQGFIGKTSWWSKGQQPPVTPERTEDQNIFCDCFQNINDKNERIEEAKYHMLQEELHFKRKLYGWNLKAAQKEVQIKNEILLQIKIGGLVMRNLYEASQNK